MLSTDICGVMCLCVRNCFCDGGPQELIVCVIVVKTLSEIS